MLYDTTETNGEKGVHTKRNKGTVECIPKKKKELAQSGSGGKKIHKMHKYIKSSYKSL